MHQWVSSSLAFAVSTLIFQIAVEVGINLEGGEKVAKSINVEVGINVKGGIVWKKN